MRLLHLVVFVLFCAVYAAPQSRLQFGDVADNGKQFVEEVVVESTLHIKTPANRQARTNVRTNLQDGTRVAELKNN